MSSSFETAESNSETKEKPGVYVRTYGCQMNEYDSEKIFALLSSKYRPVQSMEEAEVIIVNTCSVREKAESKLYSLLGTLRDLKNERPGVVLGVTGCVAQQEGEKILKRSREVDFVVGTHNLSLIPGLVSASKDGRGRQVAVDYRDEWEDLPEAFTSLESVPEDAPPVGSFGAFYSPVRAMVAIQRGCNKNCAFCVVPHTRGREVSRHPDEIERELRLKVRLGAREVMLLGQTVNSYGRDLNPRVPFDELVRRLANIEGLRRIRFTSPHPAEVRPEFIKLYETLPSLCPQIHLPLQSGSDRILRLMNRNYRMARYLEIVDQLRTVRGDIALTSDFIVGFPTESEEDFEQTLEAIERVQYAFSYSFKYSRRPNTAAISRFNAVDEVPREEAERRLARLQRVQEGISERINGKTLGTELEVLVEGKSTNISSLMRGRTPHNTPVEISGGMPSIGELVRVRIEHHSSFGLRGSLVN